jgi:hypothetical protein
LPANNQGDLIDPNNGNVIARAGNERRYYEAARNAQTEVMRVRTELDRTTAQLEAFREAAVLPQQLGLQPAEVSTAMQFMAHWKKNPVEAATKVLTELRAMGYEVDGLGASVDMGALKKMVNDAVAPFQQDREAAAREAEVAQTVDRELNNLYRAFPWAQGQQQELMNLLDADKTLTLREAALMLQSYALQHGYDLNQSLAEQALAQQNGNKQPQRPSNARVPAPSPTGDAPIVPRRPGTATGHERRNRDIVLEAMREAGLNIEQL